jgi:hypothetical protein
MLDEQPYKFDVSTHVLPNRAPLCEFRYQAVDEYVTLSGHGAPGGLLPECLSSTIAVPRRQYLS